LKGNVKKNVLGGYLRLNARNKIKVVGERGRREEEMWGKERAGRGI
jgi:hypothetical protein